VEVEKAITKINQMRYSINVLIDENAILTISQN